MTRVPPQRRHFDETIYAVVKTHKRQSNKI